VLPFGFYPITKTRKAGLIIPQDFNFAEREGLGLQDFGWYQPINEHMDVKLLFSAFVNGSVGVAATTNYNYKYKSAGNVVLRYNRRVNENTKAEKVVSPSFGLQISHRQDPNAHPTRKISGSVNIETNRDQNRNQNDFQSVYRNQLQSNFTLNKIFPGKPYQFNLAFTHNQNTQTRKMNITLPEATFTLQRIYPFKRQNGVGKERWYEKLSLVYNSQLRNSLSDVPDTSLFTRKALQNIKSGIQHKASTDFNMKLAKFINITPNLSYEENWYPYIIDRQFDPTPTYKYDSVFQVVAGEEVFLGTRIDSNGTKWGRDTLIRKYGFNSYRNFNASIGASTSIFGTVQFRKGWLKGIRHKISPSISMGYSPDYSQNTRIFREVSTSSRPGRNKPVKYSIFDEGIYSKPSSSPRSMILSYSLLNVLEIKHFSKRDTTGRGKKTKIFDNLNFSGNYNFSADSLNWSTIGTNGVFRFFKGLTTLNWRLSFDPYDLNTQGRRINTYNINNGGGLLRLDQFGISVNTGLSVRQLRDMIEGKDENAPKTNSNPAANNSQKQDDFLSWFDRFNLTHTISYERQYVPGTSRDTFLIGFHNLSVRGDIPVSSKWTLNISNISYDFQDKEFVFPDFGITRDLHCWQMSLSWQPARGTYFFTINAKPGTFQFLKVPYRQNNFDAQGGF
jgi:hypothetical protein